MSCKKISDLQTEMKMHLLIWVLKQRMLTTAARSWNIFYKLLDLNLSSRYRFKWKLFQKTLKCKLNPTASQTQIFEHESATPSELHRVMQMFISKTTFLVNHLDFESNEQRSKIHRQKANQNEKSKMRTIVLLENGKKALRICRCLSQWFICRALQEMRVWSSKCTGLCVCKETTVDSNVC